MKQIRTKICILGGGILAHLCAMFLSVREKDALVLADSHYGMLDPTTLRGVSFNIIPIFATYNSILTKIFGSFCGSESCSPLEVMSYGTSIDYHYRHANDSEMFRFINETFKFPQTALCLAEKHLGRTIFLREYPELVKKIKRHYSGISPVKRVGFKDGFSSYYTYMKKIDIPSMRITPRDIELKNKMVVTETCKITYDHLISTISLDKLIKLCHLPFEFSLLGEGASFLVFETNEKVRPNCMVYDYDWLSPVYRVFIPRENILIVQIAQKSFGMSLQNVAERVCHILDLQTMPECIAVKSAERCYPLGVSNQGERDRLFNILKSYGVFPFGRFGSWEYKDLHELDWELLNEIAFN